jgi:long-chain acyl-CoA synthetase
MRSSSATVAAAGRPAHCAPCTRTRDSRSLGHSPSLARTQVDAADGFVCKQFVGRAFQGCEIKIADDGEILVRGPNVFLGYYKNPEATKETLEDGWLHTGDIGELDEDGYLSITGRMKDIIITAGGKNITPANLEAEIKQCQYVSQCVVIGDRRPYLVALITLDMEECAQLCEEKGWPADPAELRHNEEMRAIIQKHIDEINQKFARVEQVKKFEILPHDLSQETGELTPTMKVKRNVVADKFEKDVEELYA